MSIRRTRMFGGEGYIKKHHDDIEKIKEIVEELKSELEKNKNRREQLKKDVAYVKTIRTRKNELLKASTEDFKKEGFKNLVKSNFKKYVRKDK